MEHINYLKIANILDINEGDTLFVSSDLVDLFSTELAYSHKRPNVNLFIDTLIEKIGPEGTMILPTYNWDFCKGITYDWKNSKGKTGSLGNSCLKRTDFKRTKHPIYSYAVYGKDQQLLCDKDFIDSFGPESVFNYIDQKHAKQLAIGVNLDHCFTYVHYVEELFKDFVEYRFIKEFSADYIDEFGVKTHRTYSMFVKHLDKYIETCLNPLEDGLIQEGLVHKQYINGVPFEIVPDVHATQDYIKNDIINNKSRKICKYIGQ